MVKIYMFSYESMCMDLLYNGVEELEIEITVANIIRVLELSKVISIGRNYIVGNIAAFLLKERYEINCEEEELI